MTTHARLLMGQCLRAVAGSCGFVLQRRALLPPGSDLFLDLSRLGGAFAGGVLMDVGANIGQTAIRFAAAFPGATIHSFEPIPAVFERLRATVAHLGNVHSHCLALGANDGAIDVWPKAADQQTTLVPSRNRSEAGDGNPVKVTVLTMDRFCRENGIGRIDLLKTDTEGFDLDVLRGAEGLLRTGAVRLIYAECGLRLDDTEHTPLGDLQRFLEPLGYDLHCIHDCNRWRDGISVDWANALFVRNPRRCAPHLPSPPQDTEGKPSI